MSSIIHRPNGHRWIQFICGPKRHTLRLGAVAQRAAEGVQRQIDSILCSRRLNLPLEADCRAWLAGLDPEVVARLAELGLISQAPTISLGEMMDRYLEQIQVKSSTRITYERACKDLLNRFGRDRVLGLVSSGDARGFSEWLSGQAENPRRPSLSPASVSGRLAQATNMFAWAVRQGWISENPFQGIARPLQTNPDRLQFVSQEIVRKVVRHCDPDTGLVMVLARWGGLRVPSEVDALRWRDIDWDRETMAIRSIKTERHQSTRTIPLFPLLREFLSDSFSRAPVGSERVVLEVVTRPGLHRRVLAAIHRAGVSSWPRLFQNLRASRETELADRFPSHVVAGWIGHSRRVAQEHYLQITPEHLRIALSDE